MQELKSNHGGVRSVVSSINLLLTVCIHVFYGVPLHACHTALHTQNCCCCTCGTLASSIQGSCQIDVRLGGLCTVYDFFFSPSPQHSHALKSLTTIYA